MQALLLEEKSNGVEEAEGAERMVVGAVAVAPRQLGADDAVRQLVLRPRARRPACDTNDCNDCNGAQRSGPRAALT